MSYGISSGAWQNFYPRPPRGGRRSLSPSWLPIGVISIHALREEGDLLSGPRRSSPCFISIHALREEGDLLQRSEQNRRRISIHALREEGDQLFAVALS